MRARSRKSVAGLRALADLDRAKTAFFSNVSHEFRTPLTLMLGPVEELLADGDLSAAHRDALTLTHRNALRLRKLVNTLLDFSRIEAGRIEAVYEPVDLAEYTTELSSAFRAAIDKAGVRFIVDCEPIADPVYVDREMWEKIVLNLISNAFKFTFEGEIRVTIRRAGDHATLEVRDTGSGIPADQVAHVFERFHRVEATKGRTHEGTGIGLALVHELVKLHGGTIQVDSVLGAGTAFTISVPLGHGHLPAAQVARARSLPSTGVGADAFVEEALRWLPEAPALPVAEVARDDRTTHPRRRRQRRHAGLHQAPAWRTMAGGGGGQRVGGAELPAQPSCGSRHCRRHDADARRIRSSARDCAPTLARETLAS